MHIDRDVDYFGPRIVAYEFDYYRLRWHAFLTHDLPVLCEAMRWTPPRVFAFTGGVVEASDLVHRLRALGLYATLGPPHAGLVGAALQAME
jgi:hypothetical protein